MKSFVLTLVSLGWHDVLDILLNTYILFRLYVLFRETIVFRFLVGIAVLWFFQRIAASMNLVLTSWVTQGITAAAAIIVILVFRNEIRTVLQARSLKALLWGYPTYQVRTPTEILSESAFELARLRHGALIVFGGKDDLKEFVHSGIPWDGKISQEMVQGIFYPGNPVHDGAAVVSGNRIQEVGAILPVSRRSDLPSYYGTRHRAAIGLTEVTDGLVVAVSEERGRVTVCKGGRIKIVSGRAELEKLLREHLGMETDVRGAARKRQKLEFAMAGVLSLVFISGLWFAFARGLDTLVALEVPIEYMNRDPNVEILDTSVNAVKVQLSGSGTILKNLRPDQVRVRLDLSKAVVGHNDFTITSDHIVRPPGATLRMVEPSVVQVTLDSFSKKELPVQVDWVGKLPEHLILSQVKIEPEKVVIRGGATILERLSTVYTEKVRLDALEGSGPMTVSLALTPASLRVDTGYSEKVKITYQLKEREKVEKRE
jgi:diadenylate cyclase